MKDFAADLGIRVSLIYRWRKIYTEEGDKTKLAEQQDSLRQLQLENAELKMENEMLKKQRPTLRNIWSKISFCSRERWISRYKVSRYAGVLD